ncbi:unannotated protein [freshwater metagenome]|uniref:Unannotated protein n=1 Tax=freshwater metagenome TaxID=449393 RepID=A0A6J7E3S2_9ZZZZ
MLLATRGIAGALDDPEQFTDAADEQALLIDFDPDSRGRRKDNVITRCHRHAQTLRLPPVDTRADIEHDPVLRRRLMIAGRHQKPGPAYAIRIKLLDHDPVEEWPQLVTHGFKDTGDAALLSQLHITDIIER